MNLLLRPHWKPFNCSQCRLHSNETGMLKVTAETQRAVTQSQGKPEVASEGKTMIKKEIICIILS